MSYLTKDQLDALTDIEPGKLRALSPYERLEIVQAHKDLEVRKKEAFWNAVQGFALGALPIFSFFGLTSFLSNRRG